MRSFQLVLKIIILCSATTFSISLKAQTLAGLALKNLERQKWQRAGELLSKALSKDSLNVTAKYVLAQYFFSDGNPAYHLDSAYRYSLEAMEHYSSLATKQRERLTKFPLDSTLLVEQRDKIETAAFHTATREHTEAAFNHFIDYFTSATALPRAIHLRDSIAFNTAATLNTYTGFQDFLTKYPTSALAGAARQNYETILFEVRTADKSLAAYENFLNEHPTTPFRSTIEQNIFEYRTASGIPDDFIRFIREYPTNTYVKKAGNILFHLVSASKRDSLLPSQFVDDSVRRVLELDHRYLTPFFHNKKYGLMNAAGIEIIPASLDSLDEAYHCGNIDEDLIVVNNAVIAKDGSVIWTGLVASVDDIGAGFLMLENGTCKTVIHKSGFALGPPCVDDARVLSGRIIALLDGGEWSLWTLGGRQLLSAIDDVRSFGSVVNLKRNNEIELMTLADLCELPVPSNVEGAGRFDTAEPWSHNLIMVNRKQVSALLDQSLNLLVPFGHHTLSASFFGGVVRDTTGAQAFNLEGKTSKRYQEIVVTKRWLAAKDSSWNLLDPITLQPVSGPYDSVTFSGSAAVAPRGDSTHILFNLNTTLGLKKVSEVEYIQATDSTFFLVISLGTEKKVYDHRGKKLFASSYDKLQYAGSDFFIGHRKEKKALLTSAGKVILPAEYDAIGTVNNGKISLLKSMRFGMYDCLKNQLIKPAFDKNMAPYNASVVSANKDGLYGLVDWKSKPLTKFEFNEIEYWNDTTMLVKKNSKWMLYEIKTGNILLDDIRAINYIRNRMDDKLAIVYAGANHGVIHNRKGIVIPISFTDLVNVGSEAVPMYFTEKHVEEASIFVVIYYDHEGKFIRKEVYDQADYDSIFCHTN